MSIVYPYSFAPAGLSNAGFFSNTNPTVAWSTIGFTDYKQKFRAALGKWSAVSGVMFFETTDPGTAVGTSEAPVMRVYLGEIDGDSGGNTAAAAYYPASTKIGCDIMFDKANMYPGDPFGLFTTLAIHELGHAVFGMLHNSESDSVMNGISQTNLGVNDKTRAKAYAGNVKTRGQELGVGGVLGRLYSSYRAIKNADPDHGGLYYWSKELTKAEVAGTLNTRWQQFTDDFVLQVSSWTNAQFVANLYQRVLNRTPSSSEQSGGESIVASIGRAAYLRAMVDSPEAATRRNSLWGGVNYWF